MPSEVHLKMTRHKGTMELQFQCSLRQLNVAFPAACAPPHPPTPSQPMLSPLKQPL